MGRDVGDINGVPEIAVQKAAPALVVFERALCEPVWNQENSNRHYTEQAQPPEIHLAS
jgi:hypothetical protein